MTTALRVLALCLLLVLPAKADGPGFHDSLLDRLTGNWVMTGTIAGDEITHDLEAEWVLGHWYFRFHEISREKESDGTPAYEAIVFIGWDEPTSRYACLWLDITGGSGLSNGVIGYAKREQDTIPFVFDMGDGSAIHNTFAYDRERDTWNWTIDTGPSDALSNFARVTLTRSTD